MTVRVDVQHADGVSAALSPDLIASWVNRTINAVEIDDGREVSVRVVGTAEMQQLNAEFRGKDTPTNVLSFPAGAIDGLPRDSDSPLGDVIVCASVVNAEAHQQQKTSDAHWAHMLVHGTLHLLGFDHDVDDDATEMEGLEIRILANHGIANPYAESASET